MMTVLVVRDAPTPEAGTWQRVQMQMQNAQRDEIRDVVAHKVRASGSHRLDGSTCTRVRAELGSASRATGKINKSRPLHAAEIEVVFLAWHGGHERLHSYGILLPFIVLVRFTHHRCMDRIDFHATSLSRVSWACR